MQERTFPLVERLRRVEVVMQRCAVNKGPVLPNTDSAALCGAWNTGAAKTPLLQQRWHVFSRRYKIWFLLLYVGTLAFLSLDNAGIRSVFDEHRGPSPVSKRHFFFQC